VLARGTPSLSLECKWVRPPYELTRRKRGSLPTPCAAHREPSSCEVDVRRCVVCDVLRINPLKKGTVPFLWMWTYGGVRGNAMRGCGDVASDNRQDSNQRRLARAPRRGLRGQSSQVHPTTIASRAVRHTPVSRCPVPRQEGSNGPRASTTSRRLHRARCPPR